jgi:acyl-[acyl carrier protein]--UDP-N-acetylglucosamine O-acyltransferase
MFNLKQAIMYSAKERLTSEVAGIILKYVTERNGRLSRISEVTGINRREFNRRGLAKMKLHRLLRIVYALALYQNWDDFEEMMHDISDKIYEYVEDFDECLLTERSYDK